MEINLRAARFARGCKRLCATDGKIPYIYHKSRIATDNYLLLNTQVFSILKIFHSILNLIESTFIIKNDTGWNINRLSI